MKHILNRRDMLTRCSSGFGLLALQGMLGSQSALAATQTHFKPKAKSVIFCYMSGGASHIDTFDYKPQLAKDHGKAGKLGGRLMKSPWEFKKSGKSGLWISSLLPNIAKQADDLCLLKGMH